MEKEEYPHAVLDDSGVLQLMQERARVIGPWELYRRVPEEKRVTEFDPDSQEFIPRGGVTPERMSAQVNLSQKYPVPKTHPSRQNDMLRHGAR